MSSGVQVVNEPFLRGGNVLVHVDHFKRRFLVGYRPQPSSGARYPGPPLSGIQI